MASLMDIINTNMNKQPTQTPSIGQRQIEQVLRAKSGKAGTGGTTTPAASGLMAESAQQQGQQALREGAMRGAMIGAGLREEETAIKERQQLGQEQLASKAKLAREGMMAETQMAAAQRQAREEQARMQRSADENMKLDAMQANATQRLRDLMTQREVTMDNLFAEFDQSNKELEFRKDQSELEQLGFDLALSDRSYIDELNRIGRERMLTNELQFSEESARITLGDNLASLIQQLDWARSFNSDRRSWEEKLGQMSLDDAMQIYEMQVKGANERAIAEGIGQMGGKTAEYGNEQGWFSSSPSSSAPTGNISQDSGSQSPTTSNYSNYA